MTTSYHLVCDKLYLIRAIARDGAHKVLEGWENSDADAIQAIADYPKEYIPIGYCNNQDRSGRCLGHPIHEEEG